MNASRTVRAPSVPRARSAARRGRSWSVCAGLVAVFALAACTNVPSTSAPQRVESVAAPDERPTRTCLTNDQTPLQVVRQFLDLSTNPDRHHALAGTCLTAQVRGSWKDDHVTIIADQPAIGDYNAARKSLVVTGNIVGNVDDGVYTPNMEGIGLGGKGTAFEFKIKATQPEPGSTNNEIDGLPPTLGVLLTVSQFRNAYREHPLYFFDTRGRYLVPDLRWSSLTGLTLQRWLLAELSRGPQKSLANAVEGDTLPAGLSATGSDPIRIDVPGVSQLDDGARNRIAAQIVKTLDTAAPDEFMTITDGGRPVTIPVASARQFTVAAFGSSDPLAPTGDVYYLKSGKIVTSAGNDLSGRIRTSSYFLSSVAVAQRGDLLDLAAVAGTGATAQLLVGSQNKGLTPTSLKGSMTRPAWAPGLAEVWVGLGGNIWRWNGQKEPVDVPTLPPRGRILALRLSAEGSRIAIVFEGANRTQVLYVGAVVRSGNNVSVDQLVQVTPNGVDILDVGWLEQSRLFCVGYLAATHEPKVFEVNTDGSDWSIRDIAPLPSGPNTVTAAANNLAWVSVGSATTGDASVWRQDGGGWSSPGGGTSTRGQAPIYLE